MGYERCSHCSSVDFCFFSTGNSEAVPHHDFMLYFLYRFTDSETEVVLAFAQYTVSRSAIGIRHLGDDRSDLQSDLYSLCLFILL